MKLTDLESRLINSLYEESKSTLIDALEKKKDWNDECLVGHGFKVPGTDGKTVITIRVDVRKFDKELHREHGDIG